MENEQEKRIAELEAELALARIGLAKHLAPKLEAELKAKDEEIQRLRDASRNLLAALNTPLGEGITAAIASLHKLLNAEEVLKPAREIE